MEIERKYEVLNLPKDLERYQSKKIEQGYLCHDPIIRIRKSNDQFILTYKSKLGIEKIEEGSAIINHEVELPLTEDAYYTLKTKTDGHIIYKTRYLIPIGDALTAELDVFENILEGLYFVEVEFPDIESANHFIPPIWFGKDLSSDGRFSNYHLSQLSSFEELQWKANTDRI